MNNPFESIEARLSTIENLILDLKHLPIAKNTINKELEDSILNIEEAAKFLHLAVPTIRSKASRKELPFMKRGKLLYFSQKELTDYLKKGKVKSNDEIEAEVNKYLSKKKGDIL